MVADSLWDAHSESTTYTTPKLSKCMKSLSTSRVQRQESLSAGRCEAAGLRRLLCGGSRRNVQPCSLDVNGCCCTAGPFRVRVPPHANVNMNVYVYAQRHTQIYIYIYVCSYISLHMCIHTYMYTRITEYADWARSGPNTAKTNSEHSSRATVFWFGLLGVFRFCESQSRRKAQSFHCQACARP